MMNPLRFHRMMMALVLATVCVTPAAGQAGDAAFDAWAEDLAAQAMRAEPESATRAQYFKGDEQDAVDRRLTPISKAFRAEQVAFARRALAALNRFEREKLDPQQLVSARLIEWHMQEVVRGE